MIEYFLTTIDNPFDYFTDFKNWYNFDAVVMGYHTCETIDRLTYTDETMTQQEVNEEIKDIVDKFLDIDISGMYKRISREMAA